jgi:hypothetical protein
MAVKKPKAISPFRNVKELEEEITQFMNIHKAKIANQANRMSDYFEMCCFNYIVKYYTSKGYIIEVENLQAGKYRYKCSTQGNHENFSNFKISKTKKGETFKYGIHHNIAVQSAYQKDIYTTPDISVINYGSIEEDEEHYEGKRKLSFVANANLVTFCEAKQYTPFPELIFSFIGVLNELKPDIMNKTQQNLPVRHLAPSLMISGKPNDHVEKIKRSLESRHCINVIFDLFAPVAHPFSSSRISFLKSIRVADDYRNNNFEIEYEQEEETPF